MDTAMPANTHFSQLLDWFDQRRTALEEISNQKLAAEELLGSVEYELQHLVRHLEPVMPEANKWLKRA
jgi:hypothetical protein